MVAEGLASKHVADVHFEKWNGDGGQRVPKGDAGVGEPARVHDDPIDAFTGGQMNPINQGTFVIRLEGFNRGVERRTQLYQSFVDLVERGVAIDGGLSEAEPIEVGAVKHPETKRLWFFGHLYLFELFYPCSELIPCYFTHFLFEDISLLIDEDGVGQGICGCAQLSRQLAA